MSIDSEISGLLFVNETNIPNQVVEEAVRKQVPEIAALERWSLNNQGRGARRYQTLFDRDRYLSPTAMFDKFRTAQDAAMSDDVVSGVLETTEQLAFKRVALEVENEDQGSIWSQIADDLDTSQRMREIWRELFIISQAYPAVYYGRKTYKVKGKSTGTGTKRKKEYRNLVVPLGITLLDPLKVIPVGNFMFNRETLVYLADTSENDLFESMAGENSSRLEQDPIFKQLLTGERYIPSRQELKLIHESTGVEGAIENRMWILNPNNVWRVTSTRQQYKRFADMRLESVFELLDLKHQLRQMDRASLIGSTNAIILVKKGSEKRPAKPGEIEALAQQVTNSSRQPIIVGDDRIEIEIVTPKTDKTLAAERYNSLDSRITARLYQILNTGNYAAGTATDNSGGLFKVIASSMEARRDNIRDSLMTHVFRPTWEKNDVLVDEPKMGFYPRRIALDFDPTIADYLQQLRDRGDISRETILAELDILEEDEAVKRKREAKLYDDIFTPTNVPFDSPEKTGGGNPKAVGTAGGGKNNGGGRNPASSKPSPNKAMEESSLIDENEELEGAERDDSSRE